MICVFDCETIPDVDLLRAHFHIAKEDDLEASLLGLEKLKAETGSSFPPLPFHKIVAIGAVLAEDDGSFKRVNTIKSQGERELLEEFLGFINSHNPQLVTFNGRTFDLPLIFMRALKYNLSCPAYFEQENSKVKKSKWDNYRSRYSENFHLDLLDVLANYGAVRGLKLDTICQMAGLPGKFDMAGGDVLELYYQGELGRIQEYCQSDVLNTYLLYLKYRLLKGELSQGRYYEILARMAQDLPQDRGYSQVFLNFLQKELNGRRS
ncbi:MAG: 3'-5' exonuclease [Nitratiruptor sp.]|nr:3'-5' exonuclease [Nitratiruptor sp.]NPA83153.1 3'-5' exonuclease [Campylobacterota bacterium]